MKTKTSLSWFSTCERLSILPSGQFVVRGSALPRPLCGRFHCRCNLTVRDLGREQKGGREAAAFRIELSVAVCGVAS
jgi:hypothetical protein